MTREEQALADDKMRAEIAKLISETSKLNAETAKLTSERFWIPFTIFAGFFATVMAILPRLLG